MNTKALRQRILDLAIRGKLVPQDPNDEPASVLLERIRAQKQQMVKEGKLKPKDIKDDTVIFVGEDNLHYEKFADGSVKCIEDEIPFELPEGWGWCRLQNFTSMSNGTSRRSGKCGIATTVLRLADLTDNSISYSNSRSVILSEDEVQKYALSTGDILFIRVNGNKENVGRSYYFRAKPFQVAYCDHLIRCTPLPVLDGRLLAEFMRCTYVRELIQERMVSAAGQNTISQPSLGTLLLPIPPLNEQNRIMQKFENVDTFIMQISNARQELSEIIKYTKAKILDLAIRGKLVPQDPNDEPASVLLERIRAEKEELIKQGKNKRNKKESVIFKGEDNSYYEKVGSDVRCIDDELPFEIPNSWVWTRLENCCKKEIRRGKSPKYADFSTVLALAQKCNTKSGEIDISLALGVDEASLPRYGEEEYMQPGDTVINSTGTGTLGRVGLFEGEESRIVPDSHVTVIRPYDVLQQRYIYLFLKENQSALEQKGEGATNQKELKPITLKEMLVPIPPAVEQDRIVKSIRRAFSCFQSIEDYLN